VCLAGRERSPEEEDECRCTEILPLSIPAKCSAALPQGFSHYWRRMAVPGRRKETSELRVCSSGVPEITHLQHPQPHLRDRGRVSVPASERTGGSRLCSPGVQGKVPSSTSGGVGHTPCRDPALWFLPGQWEVLSVSTGALGGQPPLPLSPRSPRDPQRISRQNLPLLQERYPRENRHQQLSGSGLRVSPFHYQHLDQIVHADEYFYRQACVLLHKISKQTLAKEEGGLRGNSVYIENCRSSRIYLLAPMKSVHVERCSHCLLVLGAVEVTVTISNCTSLVLVAACRRLHVSSCSLCDLHLLTATRPVVSPPSRQLTFAPYNTHYPQLEEHLKCCGLPVTFNLWNRPLYTGSVESETEVWTELDSDLFRPFSVPFQLSGDTLVIFTFSTREYVCT
jgi:hypothetical protein